MKIDLYMDVFSGWNPQFASATANPTWYLTDGQKRLKFTVEIPDYLLKPEHTTELSPVVAKEWKPE